MNIDLKVLRGGVKVPKYSTEGSAALDLHAEIEKVVFVGPYERLLIPTGVAIHIEDPTVAAVILPPSGIGHKKGIILGNGTGLIDSDYQGELMISCWNTQSIFFEVNPGDRIAQLIFLPIIETTFIYVNEFETTDRGEKGFGSTGK